MRTFIAIKCFEDLRQLTVCSICFSISADQPSLTVHSAINTVYFSTLWATLCRVKWHWNQHLIAALGMRLIAHESMSSAMLSAVRKSPSAISTQVMSSYCPIYLLTLTKGYRGEKEANNERLWERERFVFQIKRIHSGFFMRSTPFLHFWLSCIAWAWPALKWIILQLLKKTVILLRIVLLSHASGKYRQAPDSEDSNQPIHVKSVDFRLCFSFQILSVLPFLPIQQ